MNCKVCKKNIDRHSSTDIRTCLKKGFGIHVVGARELLRTLKMVSEQSQPSSDKRFFELILTDGTKIETKDIDETFAVILITRCYTGAEQDEKPEAADVVEATMDPVPEESNG